jgi:UDP-glucose 4-epimerase
MREISGKSVAIEHGPARAGDVRHSLADIGAARAGFGYEPTTTLEIGLPRYWEWASREVGRT